MLPNYYLLLFPILKGGHCVGGLFFSFFFCYQVIKRTSGGADVPFEIDAFRKHCLVNGLDDIGLTLEKVGGGWLVGWLVGWLACVCVFACGYVRAPFSIVGSLLWSLCPLLPLLLLPFFFILFPSSYRRMRSRRTKRNETLKLRGRIIWHRAQISLPKEEGRYLVLFEHLSLLIISSANKQHTAIAFP